MAQRAPNDVVLLDIIGEHSTILLAARFSLWYGTALHVVLNSPQGGQFVAMSKSVLPRQPMFRHADIDDDTEFFGSVH